MRVLTLLAFAALAACSKAPEKAAAAQPAEISFDGADVTDAAAGVAHGERLTHVLGCTGCHDSSLTGQNFTKDEPQYGPLYASNLTRVLPNYSDKQLERLLRTGVHPIRKTLWAMPSEIFQNLSTTDMQDLILYLRSLTPRGEPTPPPRFNALDRKEIAEGLFKPAARLVAEYKRKQPLDLGPQYALGRYITTVTCEECHGPDLRGREGGAPDLIVAGGYTRGEFEQLITTGVPVGGRKLRPAMVAVAKGRFPHLTPHERDALYAYLRARAEQPQ